MKNKACLSDFRNLPCRLPLAGIKSVLPARFVVLVNLFFLAAPAWSNTYEFELSSQKAVSASKKIDASQIKQGGVLGNPTVFSRDAKLEWKSPQITPFTVSTGPDALFMSDSRSVRIYDFKKKRIHFLDTEKKTTEEVSLYGELAFRLAELKNRHFLQEMMSRAFQGKPQAAFFDKFYSEQMFGLLLKEKNSAYKLTKFSKDKEEVYTYKSADVACFLPGALVSPEKKRQFSRFLIYGTYLHPDIRLDIERTGKLPQKLMCFLDNSPVSAERLTFTLKKVSPGEYSPKTSAYKRSFDKSPLKEVYERLNELGGNAPTALKEETLAYFAKACADKNYFDALLCLLEYGLQTGNNLQSEMSSIKNEMNSSSDCQKLMLGVRTPANDTEALESLSALDSIDRKLAKKSYLLDIFRANLLIGMSESGLTAKTTGETDPVKAFLSVLRQNPFITGVYTDLGRLFESSYRHQVAWDCYDLARSFYPQHPFLQEINDREKDMEEKYPQFFQGDRL